MSVYTYCFYTYTYTLDPPPTQQQSPPGLLQFWWGMRINLHLSLLMGGWVDSTYTNVMLR